MTGFESKRKMAQAKLDDDDDTQAIAYTYVYADTLLVAYQQGFADGKRSEQRKPLTDEMVHQAMIAINTASCGELQPTFEEMKAAIEAAHNIKEQP